MKGEALPLDFRAGPITVGACLVLSLFFYPLWLR
jgi:hypothetical protein